MFIFISHAFFLIWLQILERRKRALVYLVPKRQRASPVALEVKNPSANVGDLRHMRSIPGLGRSPGVGNGNPLQYSYLENPIDRGPYSPKSRTELDMTEST